MVAVLVAAAASCGDDGGDGGDGGDAAAVTLTQVADLDAPVDLAWRVDDDGLYVVEQPGRVSRIGADGTAATVLDLTDRTAAEGERGLLGLAFDPTGERAYVNYTDLEGNTVIAEHLVDAAGAFGAESRIVLQIEQPYPNHNGGDLTFGPDGMLYIGMGDGGDAGDPERRATDLTSLLGKLLRIDPAPSGELGYTVPPDNPYVDDPDAAPEIWSSGLRNPWKFSFDADSGDLWIADVGQNAWEEIDVAPATGGLDAGRGLSFGWSAFEGDERFNDDVPEDGHVPPVHTYGHDDGRCSISGGLRVRGEAVPELAGSYVFGDYCAGRLWALEVVGEGDGIEVGDVVDVGEVPQVTAVVGGPGGEVYALSGDGTVVRLDAA